ncbi:type I restriction endonuclease [Leuconostoc mesenteroides subsp. mesenteroides]|uniref:restriction endonuclease subunit S n=1 Tax=Leuconostoc mesenteroides TaxID=1245 RepID=UPI0009FD5880|nr:restriction endonuclease subunit S [Leuconostoc mesenteroides]ARN63573.1 type I restriction endonuclease [Leuconostoc mesenteroides subsp. mesenteroides]MDV8928512.1 restriction endonuclease subunit S [Leuconostoc mesenteroides]ORI88495.1 type I restriction endonuclease [Leuconostoc mesenteroides subsp. mesenteroides]ORI93250.1 type I restriction endonuclease [Leuconostoc mesenteroides subsp. mesenteroides]
MSKKTPQIRFKGFTDDWEERKLTDVTSSYSGLTYSPTDVQDKGTFVLRSSNVKNDQLVDADNVYVNPDIVNSNNVKVGDVIVVVRNGSRSLIGKHAIVIKEMPNTVIGAFMSAFRGQNGDYINALLSTNNFQKEVHKSLGATINQITGKDFSMMNFLTPKLEEQSKIGSFFKQLDETIALHQRKLDLLKEQKKGFLQKMFPKNGAKIPELRFEGFSDDWEERKLAEFTTSFSGGTPSAGNSSYYKGDIPFIRSGEINSDKTELFLTEDGLKNSSAKMVSVGDILYALYGATSGEVGISQINGAINQAILAIRPIDGYSSHFIMQWLRLQKQKIIDKYLQGGQGNLSGSIVKNLILNVPNFEEQQKIASFFKQLDDTIALHQRKLDLLKEQKKGFLQKMFVS